MSLLSTKQLQTGLLCALLFLLGNLPTASADSFFDYLPKYRKFKHHYQIDKIEYTERRTIIHFRFVAQESGSTTFYGGNHPNSWYLRTPQRMRGLEIQFKQLEVANIAVNNEIKHEKLIDIPEISYNLSRGDVVTCQVHFVRIPNYIRMLDMIEGKDGDLDQDKLNCFDIMIKTKENPLLGKSENMLAVVERFERSFSYIKPKVQDEPVLASNNTTNNSTIPRSTALRSTTKPSSTPVRTSPPSSSNNTTAAIKPKPKSSEPYKPEPIDYMPKALTAMDQLMCNTRVYLPNVVFKENETRFYGRVKAIQNIRVVAEYLKTYDNARVHLYGHTDIYGNPRKNLDLSRERALAVKRELVNMGIPAEKISIFFYGGSQPLPKYKNGGSPNRRVEVEPICAN